MIKKQFTIESMIGTCIALLTLAFALWIFESPYLFVLQVILITILSLYYIKNKVILIFLLFSIPYLYNPKYFFIDDVLLSLHSAYQSEKYLNKLIIFNMLFFSGVFLGLRRVSNNLLFSKNIVGARKNDLSFWFSVLLMVYSLIFGIQGENIIAAGGYGKGDVEKSALHEYFIVFYFSAIIFTNKKSFLQKYVIFFFLLLFCLKTLIYGGRIEIVQILLLTALVYTNFFEKNNTLFYITLALGIILSNAIESLRQNPALLFEPIEIFRNNSEPVTVLASQYGDVNQASLRIIGMISDGLISLDERLFSFISTILGPMHSIITPPEYWNLASYKQSEARSGGGGLISAFSYAWLGFLGPMLFGIFIGSIYRRLHTSKNIYMISYSLLMASSFPRWFAYYPAPLFKFCFLIVAILFLHKIVTNAIKIGTTMKIQNLTK